MVIDFRCVSSRIVWVKFKFSRIKMCGGGVGLTEVYSEEMERY